MQAYNWSREKNDILKIERGISFEEVIFHIGNGDELDVYPHPNDLRYPNQMISVVKINDYVYLVPYVESENEIFLKTIIPRRLSENR
jgi:hypothetical protein